MICTVKKPTTILLIISSLFISGCQIAEPANPESESAAQDTQFEKQDADRESENKAKPKEAETGSKNEESQIDLQKDLNGFTEAIEQQMNELHESRVSSTLQPITNHWIGIYQIGSDPKDARWLGLYYEAWSESNEYYGQVTSFIRKAVESNDSIEVNTHDIYGDEEMMMLDSADQEKIVPLLSQQMNADVIQLSDS